MRTFTTKIVFQMNLGVQMKWLISLDHVILRGPRSAIKFLAVHKFNPNTRKSVYWSSFILATPLEFWFFQPPQFFLQLPLMIETPGSNKMKRM